VAVFRVDGLGYAIHEKAMTEFSVVVDIKASPDHVLAVLCDVERWPQWTETMISVRRMDDGPFVVGSKAHIRQPKLRPAVWQVTELDEKSFAWVTRSPGLEIKGGHTVAANGHASRVTLTLRYSGPLAPLAGLLYGNLSRRYIGIEAEGLRRRCEA